MSTFQKSSLSLGICVYTCICSCSLISQIFFGKIGSLQWCFNYKCKYWYKKHGCSLLLIAFLFTYLYDLALSTTETHYIITKHLAYFCSDVVFRNQMLIILPSAITVISYTLGELFQGSIFDAFQNLTKGIYCSFKYLKINHFCFTYSFRFW